MFLPIKSIGSTIGLPFLSQTEDKQLLFRMGKNGIKRLSSGEVIPTTDYEYWSQYYMLFDSATDVNSLITVQDIRAVLSSQPLNLRTLILHLSHHLFTLLPSPLFPSPTPSSTSNLLNLPTKLSQQNPTKEALNCLRVLGRILAVVFEVDAEELPSRSSSPVDGEAGAAELGKDFAWNILWRRMQVPPMEKTNGEANHHDAEDAEDGAEQFELGEHSDGEDEVSEWKDATSRSRATSSKNKTPKSPQKASEDPLTNATDKLTLTVEDMDRDDTLPSLADRLFSCTVDLLFCAGFTIPEGVRTGEHAGDKINYVIWEKGVGSTVNIGSNPTLDRHKTEVMKFLLVLLSSTIYTPPHKLPYSTNRPLRFLTHSLERRLVLSLLCSWLNTSLAPSTGGIGENLPYNYLFKLGEDRRNLVKMSLTCLLVALDFQSSSGEEAETPGLAESPPSHGISTVEQPQTLRKDGNAFRYFVSKLHRKDDFAFILNGILSVLADFTAVTNNLLPGSKKPVPYILEIFMLLWKLIDLNKRFRAYINESGKMVDIVGYILLCCLELKDNPAHHGLLRMLSYILQTLSSDPEFAVALNQPQKLTFPAKWAVVGTTGDLLIVSMYSIATTSNLNPLFQPLTITVANVAPHLKGIGVQASTRLLQLFKAFSAPHFLLADEGHPRLVYYLLETFNGILYYQLDDNPNLVYAIVRAHNDFQALATFTLASGLREVQRRLLTKAAAALAEAKKGEDRSWDNNLPAEKAALLARENESKQDLVLSTPSSPNSLRASSLLTNPLHTPGEAEEDPLASAQVNAEKQYAAPKSEKAKGKMRERADSASTLAANPELERLAAAGIGPSGYVPTQEWVSSWQKGLPLDPVLIATSELLPRVQELQNPSSPAPTRAVFNYLRSTSLADVLPKTSPHAPRKFQWSVASSIWLTSLLWGDIYVSLLPTFNGTNVKLFGVKQAAPSRREQAIQNVSNRFLSFVGAGAPPESSYTV